MSISEPICREIPDKVLKSFNRRYRMVIATEWIARPPVYLVNFISEGERCYCRFNEQGLWIEEGVSISTERIPPNLHNGFSCWIPSAMITEYFKVRLNSDITAYLCRGKTQNTVFEVLLSEDEVILRHEGLN